MTHDCLFQKGNGAVALNGVMPQVVEVVRGPGGPRSFGYYTLVIVRLAGFAFA